MKRELMLALAKKITPHAVCRYLDVKGWKLKKTNSRSDIFIYEFRKIPFMQVLIPKSTDYEMYPDDILETVRILEEVEQRDSETILTHLSNLGSDVVRFRVQSSRADAGIISLASAQQFISGLTDALRASVCDVMNPVKFHRRIGGNKIKRLLERTQFGQTEHGSFIAKVIAPLDNLEEKTSSERPAFPEMQSYSIRQGITHLLRSSERIVQAIQKNKVKSLIQSGSKKPPFSSNLAYSLVDMQLWEDASLEISVDWSPILAAEPKTPSRILIPCDYFPEIAEIGEAFSPNESEEKSEFYTGVVEELRGEEGETQKRSGEVIVKVLASDATAFQAKLDLTETQYDIAIDSHRYSRQIQFSGILTRTGNNRTIKSVGYFSRLTDEAS